MKTKFYLKIILFFLMLFSVAYPFVELTRVILVTYRYQPVPWHITTPHLIIELSLMGAGFIVFLVTLAYLVRSARLR